jgi:hypothetical protein
MERWLQEWMTVRKDVKLAIGRALIEPGIFFMRWKTYSHHQTISIT